MNWKKKKIKIHTYNNKTHFNLFFFLLFFLYIYKHTERPHTSYIRQWDCILYISIPHKVWRTLKNLLKLYSVYYFFVFPLSFTSHRPLLKYSTHTSLHIEHRDTVDIKLFSVCIIGQGKWMNKAREYEAKVFYMYVCYLFDKADSTLSRMTRCVWLTL